MKDKFWIFILFVSLIWGPPLTYARRIKEVSHGYPREDISIEVLNSYIANLSSEKYPWIKNRKYLSLSFYSLDPNKRSEEANRFYNWMIQRLMEIRQKQILTSEDIEFVAAGVTLLGRLFGGEYPSSVLKGIIFPYISPEEPITGEELERKLNGNLFGVFVCRIKREGSFPEKKTFYILPDNFDTLGFVIDNLLFFYNYFQSPQVIGEEEEGEVFYHGTNKGIVEMAYRGDGTFGDRDKNFVTSDFNEADRWANLFFREREVREIEEKADRYPRGLQGRYLSLHSINKLFPPDIQQDPQRFQPVILTFKRDIVNESESDWMGGGRGRVIPGRLKLNDLTYECKKMLVHTFGWTEIKPWMDKEWREIILNYEGNF